MNSHSLALSGKRVNEKLYFHTLLLPGQSDDIRTAVAQALAVAQCAADDFNVVKIDLSGRTVSLLAYDDFFDRPFPRLSKSWTVSMDENQVRVRSYLASLNPPILHRKEILLPSDHPRRPEYEALTTVAEQIGLFDHPAMIGFEQTWLSLVNQKGYRIAGQQLVPIGNDECHEAWSSDDLSDLGATAEIKRHLTALYRSGLSAPIQSLARNGYLDGRLSLFDYGCGRGGDVSLLRSNNIEAHGWDPYYASDQPIKAADIVNLGFVINVIEDIDERVAALRNAFSLARQLLVVSVMLTTQQGNAGVAYGDGVVTQRQTFQRYYTQLELKNLIADVLDVEAIPVGPGIVYVFSNREAEQRYLLNKQRNRRAINALALTSARIVRELAPRLRKADQLYETHRELLDALWQSWLTLGREPASDEVDELDALNEAFGNLRRAFKVILKRNAAALLEQARNDRIADLSVYFALQQFAKRAAYQQLEPGLQRDIRAFFGNYKNAQLAGQALLMQIASREAIEAACKAAADRGLGWFEPGDLLILHAGLVEQLPPLLRAYVGCGTMLYGDIEQIDLLKIHLRSSKLTLMRYDHFDDAPLPCLVERTKINLRTQDLDCFYYGEEHEPQYLYFKSRYINEEHLFFAEQLNFDEQLKELNFLNFSGYGPSKSQFETGLKMARWEIHGYSLRRSTDLPELSQPCGENFSYADFILCGETQRTTGLPNLPTRPETYNAIYDLATLILDPVIDYFGSIRLTYGFCSAELARNISGRIAPELDQHAGHERNRRGNPICSRLGAAVDFIVDDEDMYGVGLWIAENLPFDRIYLYGHDRSIHVSFSDRPSKTIVNMKLSGNDRLIPHQIHNLDELKNLIVRR